MAEIRLDLEEADGDLPPVCMCCGEPATVTKSKSLSWCPPWVGVLILAGLLPYLVVTLILTKRATLQAPFCAAHQGHWFHRNLLIWATFFLFGLLGAALFALLILLGPGGPGQDDLAPFGCLGGVVLFLVWIVIVVAAQNSAIRPKEITDYDITLQGVSDAFVDAVEEQDRKRRKGRRQRFDWEDEEEEKPRRRKKPPPSDAIEEAN